MRLVSLGRVAARAEKLRLQRLVRRQVMRAAMAAAAAVFALALLAALHVAGGLALAPSVGPVYAALIVAAVDLVLVAVLGFLAASDQPDRIELEATRVSQEARAQMAEAAIMATVIAPVMRRVGLGVVDRLIGRSRR